MIQLFWYVFQWAVAVLGGIAIADGIRACCYEPDYMDAPRFYLIFGVAAFVLFSGPATVVASHFLEKALRAKPLGAEEVGNLLLAAPRRNRFLRLLDVVSRRRIK